MKSCFYFILVFLSIFGTVYSSEPASKNILNSLSKEEKAILEVFFRTLLKDAPGGGYVIYGEKPVYWESVQPKESEVILEQRSVNDPFYRTSIIMKEGFRVWKKIAPFSKHFLIQIYDDPVYGWQDMVFINRTTFTRVIDKNLSLFRYTLGPHVTSEGLLDQLEDPKKTFSAIFKTDKVLFGIVLGYGVQNALMQGRLEYINDSLMDPKNILPLKSPQFKAIQSKNKKIPRFDNGLFYRNCGSDPSFNFKTLEEERETLEKGGQLSLDAHPADHPLLPWFGYWKNEETSSLLESYIATHSKIKKVLASDHFLEDIFSVLFNEKPGLKDLGSPLKDENTCTFTDNSKATLIGQAIWQSLPVHEEFYVSSFIKGIKSNDIALSDEEFDVLIRKRREVEKLIEAKKNLLLAENFFSNLGKQKDLFCLLPEKIYYKQLKAGEGEEIRSLKADVIASYEIRTLDNKILCYKPILEDSTPLSLTEMLPGLAKGMLGMKTGEIREIFIHPEYGCSRMEGLDENTGFIVRTELKEISTQEEGIVPIYPLKLSGTDRSENDLIKEYQELQKQVAYQYGIRMWKHYKWGQPEYTLTEVITAIQEAHRGKLIDLSSQEQQDFLVHLHWTLYQKEISQN